MKEINIDALLPRVEKPSRYIDHEINAIHKEWSAVNICFAFPDAYEVGISHLGIKILYSIVNKLSYAMADRTYLPWTDMLAEMRAPSCNTALFAWESRRPVNSFDILGITLQSELTFSNVLELIDLSGIPLHSEKRSAEHPIVMAGGPCASNPLPLVPFIDVFFIGEAEEAIVEIALICNEYSNRDKRLAEIAKLKGAYVPLIHDAEEDFCVQIRKYNNFSANECTHEPQILPWQLATHNRFVAEIMRGCTRGCRFCHAGYFYRPVRERSAEDILQDILREIKHSGWDEAGLISLSSSDYSCIRPLLKALLSAVDTDKTHISLPSLRVDTLDDELINLMQRLGREGLTIAPEAGSQRLRNIINKNLSHADIMDGVHTAIRLGWQKIKLYFMLGLPFETEDDIDAIIDLIAEIDKVANRKLQINVTLSPFVPKPFTPFQWVAMAKGEVLLSRSIRIKQHFFKRKYIKIKYHTIENSILEALITRADRSFGSVIQSAWENGARYDAWNEGFDFRIWQQAFQKHEIDLSKLLGERDMQQALPWSFVDIGISESFLREEFEKAKTEELTIDCRDGCINCGVCQGGLQMQLQKQEQSLLPPDFVFPEVSTPQLNIPETRYRVFYRKEGVLRFVSHLDWMRMLFRLISMLKLEVVYTQGFNPHPKVSLSPPLPLGVSGICEFFDISLRKTVSEADLIAAFSSFRILDFTVYKAIPHALCDYIPTQETIKLELDASMNIDFAFLIKKFADSPELHFSKTKKGKTKTYDIKQIITSLRLEGSELYIEKSLQSPALYDLLELILELDKEQLYTIPAIRIAML